LKVLKKGGIDMELNGECKLMKIYVSEDSKYKGHNLYHALVFKLREIGMAGVTVTRGIEGFGQEKRLHTARILDLVLSLPIIVEVVDTPERIEMAIPCVKEIVNEGLIMVTDVNVIGYGTKKKEQKGT
jgi:PII-like signaling protein